MSLAYTSYLTANTNLTPEEIQALVKDLPVRMVDKGAFLLQAGDLCEHVLFVESGILRLYAIDDQGKEHVIQFAPENWFITERSSFFYHTPSEYFIDAIENSTVVMLTSRFFNSANDQSESFRRFNNTLLNNHIRHLQKRINLLLGATAEQRYLDFIKLYPDLTLRVPQWMIASYLGITPEGLSRVRKELAKKNFRSGKT